MPTASELITQVRDMLDEPSAGQWTDDMLARWINEATRDLARSTRYMKGSETVPVVAGTSEYLLATYVIAVEHAYYLPGDGRSIPLMPRHYEGMDAVWGQWQNQQSSYPQWFTVIGYSPQATLKLYPEPADAANLTLIVSRIPAELTVPVVPAEDADVPNVWYDAVVDYVEYKALRRDRDQRWQEALDAYNSKRDALMNNPDFLAINREMQPTPHGSYMPNWLVDPDWD